MPTADFMAPQSRWQIPRVDPSNRWIGGVAGAIAREVGVQPLVIRISFVILAVASGAGVVVYIAAWLWLISRQPAPGTPYEPTPKGETAQTRHAALGLVVVGLIIVVRAITRSLFVDSVVLPLGVVSVGVMVAWTNRGQSTGHATMARIATGALIGVAGVIAFVLLATSPTTAILVFLAIAAIVTAVALLAGPMLLKLTRDLDRERLDRARADERARMAAHLHDSVLQTLALVQRHAHEPSRTAQLARRQERELRQWLYLAPGNDSSAPNMVRLGPALEQMADRVDEAHGVPVKVVVVGDTYDLPPETVDPLVLAVGEATVNAAKHSGAKQIDVFAEVHADRLEAFVRDTGRGFDPDAVPKDRRGIADSVLGRMKRAGGTVAIHSTLGEGTEVELSIGVSSTSSDGNQPGSPNEKGET